MSTATGGKQFIQCDAVRTHCTHLVHAMDVQTIMLFALSNR